MITMEECLEALNKLLDAKEIGPLNKLSGSFLKLFVQSPLVIKLRYLEQIQFLLKQYPKELTHSFKENLKKDKLHSWVDALLNLQFKEKKLSFFPSINSDKQRWEIERTKAYWSLTGSTFKSRTQKSKPQVSILDSYVFAELFKTNHNQGKVFAIADGAGGHFSIPPEQSNHPRDEKEAQIASEHNAFFRAQDRNISRASYFACKYAIRLLSSISYETFKEAELRSNMMLFLRNIIRTKGKLESTTLSAVRVEKLDEFYQIYGFQVGDTMLAYFDPSAQSFQSFAPARVTLPHSFQEATALLPDGFRKEEFHLIDCHLPENAIVLGLSDGAYELLPIKKSIKQYPNGLAYYEIHLDNIALASMLDLKKNPIESAKIFWDRLEALLGKQATKLQKELETNTAIDRCGDDISCFSFKL